LTAQETRSMPSSRVILLCEALLILVFFNASSFFSTTTYARALTPIGALLTLSLTARTAAASRLLWGYGKAELGLQARSVSRRLWLAVAVVVFIIYLAGALSESSSPTTFKGEITPQRVAVTAAFTLTFGPLFEELLFRGYLFRRIYDATNGGALDLRFLKRSFASVFSGVLFGLWHLPAPILVLYFHDPIAEIYAGLAGFVAVASIVGVIGGEVRRRTRSILPGAVIHLCVNSLYVLAMASRLPQLTAVFS